MNTGSSLGSGPKATLAIALLVSSAGCGEPDEVDPVDWVGYEVIALQVDHATFSGDVGRVRYDGAASSADANDDGYYINVTLWADGSEPQEWLMMTAVSIDVSVDLRPGVVLEASADDASPTILSYACSGVGDDAEELGYENSAERVTATVEESDRPGMVTLSYTAFMRRPDGAPEIVTGSFDVARAPE